jgi:hypothetical protein
VCYTVGLGLGARLAVYCATAFGELWVGRDLVTFDAQAVFGESVDEVVWINIDWEISTRFLYQGNNNYY